MTTSAIHRRFLPLTFAVALASWPMVTLADEPGPVSKLTTRWTEYYEHALHAPSHDGSTSSAPLLTLQLTNRQQKRSSVHTASVHDQTAAQAANNPDRSKEHARATEPSNDLPPQSGEGQQSLQNATAKPASVGTVDATPLRFNAKPGKEQDLADGASAAHPPIQDGQFPITPSAEVFIAEPFIPVTETLADPRYSSSAMLGWRCCCQFCGRSCRCDSSGGCLNCPSRIKSRLQRSHWGYCNYFQERPFGESVIGTMARQVAQGTAELMILYAYDFYPVASPNSAQLTPRGLYQLKKIAERLTLTSAPIQLQASGRGELELDQRRRQSVVEHLQALGVEAEAGQIVVVEVIDEIPALEALEMHRALLEDVRQRGRTVSGGESTGFTFGGFSGN